MAEMAVQGLLEFWPCKNVNKLISGCLLLGSTVLLSLALTGLNDGKIFLHFCIATKLN